MSANAIAIVALIAMCSSLIFGVILIRRQNKVVGCALVGLGLILLAVPLATVKITMTLPPAVPTSGVSHGSSPARP